MSGGGDGAVPARRRSERGAALSKARPQCPKESSRARLVRRPRCIEWKWGMQAARKGLGCHRRREYVLCRRGAQKREIATKKWQNQVSPAFFW